MRVVLSGYVVHCAWLLLILGTLVPTSHAQQNSTTKVSYAQVQAILTKYCSGCHNDRDREGKFSVSSYAALMAGGDHGTAVIAGQAASSSLVKLLRGEAEPLMPPEDEPRPTAAEIELLSQWITQGATNDTSSPRSGLKLTSPQLPQAAPEFHHTTAACQVGPQSMATGRLGTVELIDVHSGTSRWTVTGLAGKVNALRATQDGRWIVAGGGVVGVGGEAVLIEASSGQILQRFAGHADSIYCVALSPDGSLLATGSYDRKVLLWDARSGTMVRELSGHNGAVYDLDIDASGQLLASASADQTLKLWNLHTGQRLDTLGQPEREQLCVRFSPDGRRLVAGGADKQIRVWEVVSVDEPAINPMLVARFAHEAAITQLEFVDQQLLLSSSTDRSIKLWQGEQLRGLGTIAQLAEVPVGLCLNTAAPKPTADEPSSAWQQFSVMQLDGQRIRLNPPQPAGVPLSQVTAALNPPNAQSLVETSSLVSPERPPHPVRAQSGAISSEPAELASEQEPNDLPQQTALVTLPAVVAGTIASRQSEAQTESQSADQDLVRFRAQQGETWICEIEAARAGSALDSLIDVLDAQGQPLVRTRLQATRASYFTFRGKDSATSDDFRLHKWEEMELDEYLYANGEVTRLWLYPRGPDSGFKVYPGTGNRHTFFDTTPLAHALGQPTYIVRELAAEETPLPNGLPIFTLLYENDDDARRMWGKDSRLTFVAPASGEYILRVRDARGFGGEQFHYKLSLRRPQPDFRLKLNDTKFALPVGSGREWSAEVTRLDGLESPISIHLHNVPAGVLATNPLIIEAGQLSAVGTVYITDQVDQALLSEKQFTVALSASTTVDGQVVERPLEEKLVVAINQATEVQLRLVSVQEPDRDIEELTISPGQTISARVVLERHGTDSRVELGKEDSGRNLPHGAFVDNIGLNGLLIPEGQSEREFFITAAPKVPLGRRQFHLKSATSGKPTSRPVWLNVVSPPSAAASSSASGREQERLPTTTPRG